MLIGAIYCPKNKVREITNHIMELKEKHGIKRHCELKWTKISKSKESFYEELVQYFFIEDDLKFRAIVCDKTLLNHQAYNQTHDEWYHKIYYDMLKYIFTPIGSYNIFADIKDTNSYHNLQKVLYFLHIKFIDERGTVIKKIQPVRSYESTILQIADIITGALSYYYRNLDTNSAKLKIVNILKTKSVYGFDKSTPYAFTKFNLLIWDPSK